MPLLVFTPGVDLRGYALPVARQLDLEPTVLDLLGLAVEGEPLQGRSLFDGRGARPVFFGSYGTEHVFGLLEHQRKWAYDVASGTLREADLAADPSGRSWSTVPAADHADLIRRMEEFSLYNEACLRDLGDPR